MDVFFWVFALVKQQNDENFFVIWVSHNLSVNEIKKFLKLVRS